MALTNIFRGIIDTLELVEGYAEYHGGVASEEELSEIFDEQVMPGILEVHGEKGVEFEDTDRVNQAFNDWTDNLCKEGYIHQEQYDKYEYVGKWS
ncbi:MAG: hypothetical protein KDD43_13090 [Bdellovibrionales bacterium]|nr:hypothetical protein [Bdellovibrionales bacterium]